MILPTSPRVPLNGNNMENDKISRLIKELLAEVDPNPTREGLSETPARVARAFETLFGGHKQDPRDQITVFENEGYDEMIICKDIDFYSTCEHHMLPFFGKAHIGYIPDDKIIGLSKMPRFVDIFARRLQNQERLTTQIIDSIQELLQPKGLGVIIEAQHLCMLARGVQKQNASMTTSAFRGLFKNRDKTRSEFLTLVN